MHYYSLLLLLLFVQIVSPFIVQNIILQASQQDGKSETIYIETDHEIGYNLTKYTEINIINQRLHQLQKGSFVDLPHLRFLELKHDSIREIEPGAFGSLPSLMLIDLARNRLTKIRNGTFNTLPVRGLILTRNHIEIIEEGALDDLPNLVVLDLSYNKISVLSSEWFKNCPKLLDINLESNSLVMIPAMAFKNLKIDETQYYYANRYPTINLSNNQITSLSANAFSGLEEIFKLNLDRNRLSNIHPTAFEDVYKIHYLNFSVNQINCLEDSVLEDLKRTSVFEIFSNPLSVKCSDNLLKWSKNYSIKIKT